MKPSNDKHPECAPNEVFITNADDDSFQSIRWKTKRKGVVSYDINGKVIANRWRGSFPVFVQKEEIAATNTKILSVIETLNKTR